MERVQIKKEHLFLRFWVQFMSFFFPSFTLSYSAGARIAQKKSPQEKQIKYRWNLAEFVYAYHAIIPLHCKRLGAKFTVLTLMKNCILKVSERKVTSSEQNGVEKWVWNSCHRRFYNTTDLLLFLRFNLKCLILFPVTHFYGCTAVWESDRGPSL